MANLVTFVWVRQRPYGPGNPPPPELWGELPEHVWDEVPVEAEAEAGDGDADLSGLLGESLREPESEPSP